MVFPLFLLTIIQYPPEKGKKTGVPPVSPRDFGLGDHRYARKNRPIRYIGRFC
jgi:hypothetical protein